MSEEALRGKKRKATASLGLDIPAQAPRLEEPEVSEEPTPTGRPLKHFALARFGMSAGTRIVLPSCPRAADLSQEERAQFARFATLNDLRGLMDRVSCPNSHPPTSISSRVYFSITIAPD